MIDIKRVREGCGASVAHLLHMPCLMAVAVAVCGAEPCLGESARSGQGGARHRFSIVETPAGPRLAIDGKAQNAVAALPDPFVAPTNYAETGCVKGMRLMADAGVRLFSNVWSVRSRPHDWWFGEGVYDWKAFDAMAQCLLDACPDGWIMPRVKIEPPEWWIAAHPEELSSSKAEVRARSVPWRALYRRMLKDVLEHAEAAPYADRIVGWHIGGFHCGEWMDWKRPRAEFPPVDARYANDPLAPAEATAARREYERTRAREVADVLLDAAKYVKELTHGEKIVCAFFGYGGPDHEDMMRVLRSGLVDVFSSPAHYGQNLRGVGAPGALQVYYAASYALHGRLFMEEADPRTHLGKVASEKILSAALHAGRTANLAQSVGVVRRIAGKNLAQGTGLWWFLIAGNETFDAPEIMESVRIGVEESRRAMGEVRPRMTDVAVFTAADEYATSRVCHSLKLYEYRRRLHTGLLPRAGVAYDSYELSDIADPRVGDYSVYVLPNAFTLSDAEKEAIGRLEAGGKRIVRIPEPIGEEELRGRLAAAGAHVYLDTGDVVFAGRGYLTVHASKAGVKRIRLPRRCDVTEVFGAAPVRKGVTEFAEELEFGETRVYRLGPAARSNAVAKVLAKLDANPFAEMVLFDYVGYQNYRRCHHPDCERLYRRFLTERNLPDAPESEKEFFLGELVAVNNAMHDAIKARNPSIVTGAHIYPVFMPEPLYGHRLKFDVIGETCAWYLKWPDEKIREYAADCVTRRPAEYPRSRRVPFIAVTRKGWCEPKSASDIERELNDILAAGADELMAYEMDAIVDNPEIYEVFLRYCGS